MRAAQLLCAFLLFAASGASAADDCNGYTCLTETDSAALLQSKVQVDANTRGISDQEKDAESEKIHDEEEENDDGEEAEKIHDEDEEDEESDEGAEAVCNWGCYLDRYADLKKGLWCEELPERCSTLEEPWAKGAP